MNEPVVAILGGGVMGETIAASVLASGWPAQHVRIAEPRAERAADLAQRHGVTTLANAREAAVGADVVIVAVKPQDVGALLADIAPALGRATLVASVAVGLPCSFYEQRLPESQPVVRIMPNTPAVVGAGASAISPGAHAGDEHLALVEQLLQATGLVVRVPEKQQDAVAAISGSGPAYAFYILDALAEAGVLLGLPRELSARLALATLAGSCTMVEQTGEHPVILRERVSSPGGTTVAALRELDAAGVRAAFLDAAKAAVARTKELAAELDG